VTANWVALSSGPGTGTSEGYLLQASIASDFSSIAGSSQTPNPALNALTVSGLSADTIYYLRVGALNWTTTPNFVVIAGSTRTLPGPAPITPQITGVNISTTRSEDRRVCNDYRLEASTYSDITGTIVSSVTPVGKLTG